MIFELTPAGCELEHLTKSSEKQKQKKKKKKTTSTAQKGKDACTREEKEPSEQEGKLGST
jgi:hypothetical protein